ncbi:hypothetical protein QYE76_000487 [Lolium multiflorum]|uniref:CCHC-type domain-containing protein n=1 Tax=Lolium multiflorum TaxID=4521 RepID=A0AAD8RL82_LOLMU|nr:hypothetical protein QYE76_000487 [Lolium multiflorum]
MDGSAPDLRSLSAYECQGESRRRTSSEERCWNRGRQEGDPDWFEKGRGIKQNGGGRVSKLIQIFGNQSATYDPGAQMSSVPANKMVLTGGGGDQGGTGEGPTHPKPAVGTVAALGQPDARLAIMCADEALEGNWDGEQAEGKNAGPEARLAGDTTVDDEFCMEEDDDEETPVVAPTMWRMLARYYSIKAANYTLIHKHFTEVWRVRGKMIFKPLKDNFFIITFSQEGDYKFVEQGGPWIHQGVACLIAPFVDSAQPSDTVLDTVRLWVRFYDVPWKKQTKEYGETLGSKFGKVVTVDVDAEGLELSEYLRVRIDWPLSQRLLARFKITKGQQVAKIYHMRYERVPFFCFHCGFIGHNEEQCEQRIMGAPSLQYDATLRCSPKRKFQSRTVSTPDEPAAKKFLSFNTPEGSVNSSSLGIPPMAGRQARADQGVPSTDIPVAVDANDGFEEQERRTGEEIERDLANTVHNLQLKQCTNKEVGKQDRSPIATVEVPGSRPATQGIGCSKEEVRLAPNAMQIMQNLTPITSNSRGTPSGPNSSDMIPPLRGLSQLGIPLSDSDVSMADGESILGKRTAGEDAATDGMGQKLDLSLALNCNATGGGKLKKGRRAGTTEGQEEKKDGHVESVAARTRRRIATGHSKPGNLTRPSVEPRVPYTYDNKRLGRANVRVRLDRAVACPAWRDRWNKRSACRNVRPEDSGGSSTWHAIEYGLELLKTGVIWRVGNGASIRIWRDPWIPKDSNHLPQTPRGRCRYRWVADFLEADGTWNMQRLEQYFSAEDVKDILQIKPSRRNETDFVSWFPEKSGLFTVRSAYRLALHREMMRQDRGATSSRPDGARPSWRLIWKCPVPHKVRILAWKICRNAIATQAMTEVWDLPNLQTMQPMGHEWLLQILHASSEKQRAMTLMVLWRIWHAHNELTHDKPCPPIEGSRRFLVSYLNSLLMIKQFPDADVTKGKMVIDQGQGFRKEEGRRVNMSTVYQRWTRPAENEVKLNVDGAFSMDGRAGVGMVLRNSNGEVIYAACQQVQHCSDALEVELMAIEVGVKQALQWTQQIFSVESDCAEAINMIKQIPPNISAYAFRINEIREVLRERDSPLVKISREANNASHELAKLARVQGRAEAWHGCPPEITVMVLDVSARPNGGSLALLCLYSEMQLDRPQILGCVLLVRRLYAVLAFRRESRLSGSALASALTGRLRAAASGHGDATMALKCPLALKIVLACGAFILRQVLVAPVWCSDCSHSPPSR